jgi:hypothetical protein
MADKFAKETHAAAVLLNGHDEVVMFDMVGSGLYVEDPKDIDFVVLLKPGTDVHTWYPEYDRTWNVCSEAYDESHLWRALRKGGINLLVTADAAWADGCSQAAAVCAALGLESKADRVRVHRVIRDGMSWEDAKAAPMREGVTE